MVVRSGNTSIAAAYSCSSMGIGYPASSAEMRKWLASLTGNTQASKVPSPWPKMPPRSPATVKGARGWAGRTIASGLAERGKPGVARQLVCARATVASVTNKNGYRIEAILH